VATPVRVASSHVWPCQRYHLSHVAAVTNKRPVVLFGRRRAQAGHTHSFDSGGRQSPPTAPCHAGTAISRRRRHPRAPAWASGSPRRVQNPKERVTPRFCDADAGHVRSAVDTRNKPAVFPASSASGAHVAASLMQWLGRDLGVACRPSGASLPPSRGFGCTAARCETCDVNACTRTPWRVSAQKP
jgi:hypothetical protein